VVEVVLAAAEVTGLELAVDTVAAWACRESTSKITKIPAATIATCTTRQAMCRKIDCGMSSSRSTGRDRIRLLLPIISGTKHAGRNLFRGYFAVLTRNRRFAIRPPMYTLFVHHRTAPAQARQGPTVATELVADPARYPGRDLAGVRGPETLWMQSPDNRDYRGLFRAMSGHGQQSCAGTRTRGCGA
jgi:hypothetical protein